ncbi:DoxX family membrane protein [Secundilactobacillus folii]|uniref:DoxX family membrane protein n=1 Tax=Secundilactobacillus folii TaxID=2678357 RepID=A0A7X3C3R3_9LACO|nr:DoxX family membrane protein [Secundilactobacillus folii]MTV82787.1 DoxX family membrane protein [Secundilactobacillus folii]
MVKWLRHSKSAMWLTTLIRLYLAYEWISGGVEKITSGFSAKGFIMGAINHPVMTPENTQAYKLYTAFLKSVVAPNVNVFSFVVSWGELLVGLGLLFGALATAAAFFGMLMNFAYLFAGTVSVNPLFLILEFIILVAGYNASKIGLDHWIVPWMRDRVGWLKRSVD